MASSVANPVALRKGSKFHSPLRTTHRANADANHPYDYVAVGRNATVTVSALAAAAAEVYTQADNEALVGDVISVSPDPTNMEAGWAIVKAWVSADGTISFQGRNLGATSLAGGSVILYYTITR